MITKPNSNAKLKNSNTPMSSFSASLCVTSDCCWINTSNFESSLVLSEMTFDSFLNHRV